MKKTTLLLFVVAVLSGCVAEDHYHTGYPLCYDLAPGRRLSRGELNALEHSLEHRLFVDFDNDLSFNNPIGPGRCYGAWHRGEGVIDCRKDNVVVNCDDR
ncbi:MAG: hypothetical protein OXC31_23650 [Spirochaetaceae bacterium]|nr:hypothetical protein [Spirochaetaceae bacterium]